MSTKGPDRPELTENIPKEVQDRIIDLCDTAGMSGNDIYLLRTVLSRFDDPELPEFLNYIHQQRKESKERVEIATKKWEDFLTGYK